MARASARDLAELRSGKASSRDRAEAAARKFKRTRASKKRASHRRMAKRR